jgi:hypothetical protein
MSSNGSVWATSQFRHDPSAFDAYESISAGFSSLRRYPAIFGLLGCERYHSVGFFGGLLDLRQLIFVRLSLPLYSLKRFNRIEDARTSNSDQNPREYHIGYVPPISPYRHGGQFGDIYGFLCIAWACWGGFGVALWGVVKLAYANAWRRCYSGISLLLIGLILVFGALTSLIIGCLPWYWWACLHDGQEHS